MRHPLLAVSGSACRQFPQSSEETGGGFGIVQRFEQNRGRELGKLSAEANLQHVLLPNGHEGIEFRSGILLPVSAGREDDRAWFVEIPFALIAAQGSQAPAVSAPAMAHNFKMEVGRTAQIRLEGERLFLFVPAAQQPMDGQSARPEFHGDVSVFEAARRKLKSGVEAVAIQPAPVEDPSLARAR